MAMINSLAVGKYLWRFYWEFVYNIYWFLAFKQMIHCAFFFFFFSGRVAFESKDWWNLMLFSTHYHKCLSQRQLRGKYPEECSTLWNAKTWCHIWLPDNYLSFLEFYSFHLIKGQWGTSGFDHKGQNTLKPSA